MALAGKPRRVLIIVENLSVPFDRRVWSEATTLVQAGYEVSIICPKSKASSENFEILDGVHVYRHPLLEARSGGLYPIEYLSALFCEFVLSVRVFVTRGFDVIHACNPPDLIFIIGAFYKVFFGRRFLFDHHDINPELYEAKFGRRDFFWRMMLRFERWTYQCADVAIVTNNSYRELAIGRDGMSPEKTFVVRSGPNLSRVRELPPDLAWKKGRRFLVAYLGVIGSQEGLDLLLESIRHIKEVRRRNDIHYVIMGGGPELAAIRGLAAQMDLSDDITFTDRCGDETLFSVLSTADVCVNPDRPNAMNDKSTMNKIMEYMALGKPIVQFDLTEGRFSALEASLYARHDDTADFGDKIILLLGDSSLRTRMGEFGRARIIEVLAWEHEVPKLLAAYEALFQGMKRS